MANTIEINIPFGGFYESVHSGAFDWYLERLGEDYREDTGRDMPDSLFDLLFDACDWGNAHDEYARAYAEAFCDEYLPGAEFTAMESPRFYNYGTDRLFVRVSRGHVEKLWEGADKAIFDRITRERFTSCDGFISHYRNDWREWGPLEGWDHNQLGTLLLAYIETERGEEWDQWAEWAFCEDFDCNGSFESWLLSGEKAARFWKLWNYLTYDRPQRAA